MWQSIRNPAVKRWIHWPMKWSGKCWQDANRAASGWCVAPGASGSRSRCAPFFCRAWLVCTASASSISANAPRSKKRRPTLRKRCAPANGAFAIWRNCLQTGNGSRMRNFVSPGLRAGAIAKLPPRNTIWGSAVGSVTTYDRSGSPGTSTGACSKHTSLFRIW